MAINSSGKPILFAANWKLNKTPAETRKFLSNFVNLYPSARSQSAASASQQVVFFVPSTNLEAASEFLVKEKPLFGFGAQNCFSKDSGAFTGETSVSVVAAIGATHILVGHSERRQLFHETTADTVEKSLLIQSKGLVPMLCIGETLQEREAGVTNKVCQSQLQDFLKKMDLNKSFSIAYEPVWAIGTGKVATSAQVAEVHTYIRGLLAEVMGPEKAHQVPILYGGSVKADNAKELISLTDVNGFLVGGASLEVESFMKICTCV